VGPPRENPASRVQIHPSPRDLGAEALLKFGGLAPGKITVHQKPGHLGWIASGKAD